MRKLYYMGLESYEARYTLQLTEWNRRVFDKWHQGKNAKNLWSEDSRRFAGYKL